MPGSEACGRCGTSLGLATAVMDVHPPRASRLRKRLRKHVPVRKAILGARDAVGAAGATSAIHRAAVAAPWSLFLRNALPGWAHFYAGQRVRGHLFLWGTLLFLIPGLLMLGTMWGSIWLGLAFSVHSSAALDIVTQSFPDAGMRDRIARSIMVSFLLAVLVYIPIGVAILRVADPTAVQFDIPPFKNGDVVLINHLTQPRAGQIVMYRIPEQTYEQVRNGHTRYFTHFTGERIDRILAEPGDRVVWDSGVLTINGVSSEFRAMNPANVPKRLALTVPANHFLIFPSTTPYVRQTDSESMWKTLSVVPADQLMGHVYFRAHPMSRFSRLR